MIERIAHRGNSYAALENTLPAFRAALDAGCDFVELDVRTSADGTSVVQHDETLLRLWGLPQAVSATSDAQLAALGTAQARIPTLTEALDVFVDAAAGVLVDCTNPADALAALAVVQAHAPTQAGRVRVQWCGATDAMQAVRAAAPDAVIRYAADGGLSPAAVEELRPAYLNLEWNYLSEELVADAHARGLKVACWTPDDAVAFGHCRALGADAITTNRIRLLNQFLADEPAETPTPVDGLDVDRALSLALQIAEFAVAYTRDVPVSSSTDKASPADFVTNVDLAVEQLVREAITSVFPDHLVVGEELGGEPQPGVPTWYVDPVDGTTNLGNHLTWTSLSLGLAVDDVPVLGVVAQPWTGEVFAAVAGGQVTVNRVAAAAPDADRLAGSTVGTELAAQNAWPGLAPFMAALADHDVTCRIMGSGTLTVTQPALGRGAAGLVHAFNPIDHLAGVVIARAAGCRLLHPDGDAPDFPRREEAVLVVAPAVADELAALWRDALRQG